MNSRVIVNYLDIYLPTTMIWLYTQQQRLKTFQPVYLCHKKMNLEHFPADHVYALDDLPPWKKSYNFWIRKYNWLNKQYPFFTSTIREFKPLLIHAHFGDIGYQAIPYAQRFDIPLVTTFYGYDVNMLPNQKKKHFYQKDWKAKYQILFREGSLFLCEGNFMRNALIRLGCPPEKVLVHHLGVVVQKIEYRPRYPENGRIIKILVAGSFREKKGIPYALKAFAELAKKYDHIHLTLVGDAGQHPREIHEKDKIETIIREENLSNRITRFGYMPYSQLMDLFYQHHIFLSPSVTASDGDTEGGAPVSLLDASATGMAIVSSRHCDIPEVVRDGETGLLADERNIPELIRHLEHLIIHPEEINRLGSNARKHIQQEYDADRLSLQLENLYSRFIQ